jgi:hypothetical protein
MRTIIMAASRSMVPVADEADPFSTSRLMLLVLVLMRWPDSPSSMTCTGCFATDDNEAAHSWV